MVDSSPFLFYNFLACFRLKTKLRKRTYVPLPKLEANFSLSYTNFLLSISCYPVSRVIILVCLLNFKGELSLPYQHSNQSPAPSSDSSISYLSSHSLCITILPSSHLVHYLTCFHHHNLSINAHS